MLTACSGVRFEAVCSLYALPSAICVWIASRVGEPALWGTPAASPSLAIADCILLENKLWGRT